MVLHMVGQVTSVNLIDWFPLFIAPTVYTFALAGIGLALTGGLILYFYAVRERSPHPGGSTMTEPLGAWDSTSRTGP